MNIVWFFLALSAGLGDSWSKASQKWAVSSANYSKAGIAFCGNLIASIILFSISYLIIGLPQIKEGFWAAVLVTGVLNALTFPMLLRAYEIGEFSSVYSMILLTPAFLFITSFFFLGETPSLLGIFGVLLTILGLYIITKNHGVYREEGKNFIRGNLLGILVALIWAISVNFDKLSASNSDSFFAPAVVTAIMATSAGIYILLNYFFFPNDKPQANPDERVSVQNGHPVAYLILVGVGALFAFTNIFHNLALLYGPASYTIAVKRTGVLWGVVWGWMFFRESNISRKLLGAVMAVAGVVVILFA